MPWLQWHDFSLLKGHKARPRQKHSIAPTNISQSVSLSAYMLDAIVIFLARDA